MITGGHQISMRKMLSWNPIIGAGKQKTIQILDGDCFEPDI
jgi:hypothetical protein